ncbi:hypothetical protein LCGC14_0162270 [marine sediment metagenome]|uniref:Type II secretion system protein GspF domain-containing protein n=1 Tax=marine sediment metagenome TaxID=412755 RepID=A0A0F9VB36_9ZZZZ
MTVANSVTIFDLLLPIAVFGLVLASWIGIVLLLRVRRRNRAQKLQQRINISHPHLDEDRVLRLWHDGKEETLEVPGAGAKPSLRARLAQLKEQSGIKAPLQAVVLGLAGGTALVASAVLVITGSFPAMLGAAVTVVTIVWVCFKNRLQRRVALFETQFLDALGLAARSLRAGHPLSGSFMVVADEIDSPVGPIFESVCQKQQLGMKLEEALRDVATITDSHDMRIFATSVIIHLRSGGNLADLVDRLATVIRDRMRLSRRIRILTASANLGKRVLIALPILMFGVINSMNPDYMAPLYETPQGKTMLLMALGGMLLGAWIMNRMAKLKY